MDPADTAGQDIPEAAFGASLLEARKSQNLGTSDVSKAIHLSVDVIDAIERSDIDSLPEPAFVQGYLRAYARFLGVPEAPVLANYSRAVPHTMESELKRSSLLPKEADSGSPFVKTVSVILLLLGFLALAYGAYTYYGSMLRERPADAEATDANDFVLPDYSDIVPDTMVPDEGYRQETSSSAADSDSGPPDSAGQVVTSADRLPEIKADASGEAPALEQEQTVTVDTQEVPGGEHSRDTAASEQTVEAGLSDAADDDRLELSASQASWVEVSDARGERLHYDLLQGGKSVSLKGVPPYSLFLGNAPAVSVTLNGQPVPVDRRIRANNTARVNISVSDGAIVFHDL